MAGDVKTEGVPSTPGPTQRKAKKPFRRLTKWEKVAAFVSGLVLILFFLFLASAVPNPPPFAYWVYRVILALAAGAFAGVMGGAIETETRIREWTIRAGGGLAVFVIVLLWNPPSLPPPLPPPPPPAPPSINQGAEPYRSALTKPTPVLLEPEILQFRSKLKNESEWQPSYFDNLLGSAQQTGPYPRLFPTYVIPGKDKARLLFCEPPAPGASLPEDGLHKLGNGLPSIWWGADVSFDPVRLIQPLPLFEALHPVLGMQSPIQRAGMPSTWADGRYCAYWSLETRWFLDVTDVNRPETVFTEPLVRNEPVGLVDWLRLVVHEEKAGVLSPSELWKKQVVRESGSPVVLRRFAEDNDLANRLRDHSGAVPFRFPFVSQLGQYPQLAVYGMTRGPFAWGSKGAFLGCECKDNGREENWDHFDYTTTSFQFLDFREASLTVCKSLAKPLRDLIGGDNVPFRVYWQPANPAGEVLSGAVVADTTCQGSATYIGHLRVDRTGETKSFPGKYDLLFDNSTVQVFIDVGSRLLVIVPRQESLEKVLRISTLKNVWLRGPNSVPKVEHQLRDLPQVRVPWDFLHTEQPILLFHAAGLPVIDVPRVAEHYLATALVTCVNSISQSYSEEHAIDETVRYCRELLQAITDWLPPDRASRYQADMDTIERYLRAIRSKERATKS